jgi:hypothetical protein
MATYSVTLTPSASTSTLGEWIAVASATSSQSYAKQIIFTIPACSDLASDGANITKITMHGYVRNGASAQKQLQWGFKTSASAGVSEWAQLDGVNVVANPFIAIDGWDHADYGYAQITKEYSGDSAFAKWIKQNAGSGLFLGIIQPQSGKVISVWNSTDAWTITVDYELLGNIPTTDKSSAKLTETITTTINRIISDSTTTLNYKIGDNVLSTVDIGTATSHTFTVPRTAGTYFPTALTSTLTVEAVTTVSGATYGTISTTATITLPDDASPTVALYKQTRLWKAGVSTSSAIGAYVQNQCGYKAQLTVGYKYGSSIVSYKAVCEGNEVPYSDGVFTYCPFTTSGAVSTAFVVTDSRGLTGTLTITNTVLPWAAPAIQSFTVQRATSDGTIAIDGTCAMVTATATASSLIVDTEKNALTFTVQYREIGATDWISADAIVTASISTSISGLLASSGTTIDTFNDMTGYEFRLSVADLYATSYASDEMPTKEQFWDIDESTGRMGFGGDAPKSDDDFSYRFHEPVDLAGGYKIYSTEEVATGNTWIDGTGIFRTVIKTTTSIVNSIGKVGELPSYIKYPVSFRAFAKYSGDEAWRPVPDAYHGGDTWNVLVYFKDNEIYMGFGSSWTGTKDIIIILEYTKVVGGTPVMSNADVISLSRGTCLSLPVNMVSDGEPVVMDETDYLVLTVREIASESSPILLQITGDNGSNVITIHESDTANMEVGKYSAEIRLYHFGCVYSVWGIDATDSREKNLKNFVILAGVGE